MDDQQEVEALKITLKIIQGDQLVAKDRNLMGQWTTSDPYLDVCIFPQGGTKGGPCVPLGQSETIRYTLSPQWDFETTIELPLPQISEDCLFKVTIMDRDEGCAACPEKLMGVVPVNVTPNMYRNLPFTTRTRWYGVPASSADRASGRIQCKIDVARTRKLLRDIEPPVYQQPSGIPVLDQATHTPSQAEREFSKEMRATEDQGDESVMTDLRVSMLAVRGSVTGATGSIKQSTLGKITLGAASSVTKSAMGGVTGVAQVASFGVNGVKQTTNLAAQAVMGGVTGVAQVASFGVNGAASVATGSVNAAAQTMKTTAGIITNPLGMFSRKEAPSTTTGSMELGMKRSNSTTNLFSSMPFTTTSSNNNNRSADLRSSMRPNMLGGTRKSLSTMNMFGNLAAAANDKKSNTSQTPSKEKQQAATKDKKSKSQRPRPLRQLSAPRLTGTNQKEKGQFKLDMAQVEAKDDKSKSSDRPRPVRQRSAPRVRKSNFKRNLTTESTKKAKPVELGDELIVELEDELIVSEPEKKNKELQEDNKGEKKSQQDTTVKDGEREKKKKLKKNSSAVSQESSSSIASKLKKKKKKKKLKMISSTLSQQSQSSCDDSEMEVSVRSELSSSKKRGSMDLSPKKRGFMEHHSSKKHDSSLSLSSKKRGSMDHHSKKHSSVDHSKRQERSSSMGHGKKRSSMDHNKNLTQERRVSNESMISTVSSTLTEVSAEEVEAMRRSICEKDEKVQQLEQELAELRRTLQRRESMDQSSASCNGCAGQEQQQQQHGSTTTGNPSGQDEAGFYVDADGVEYYLDQNGIEYYKNAGGEWYADFAPTGQEVPEDAGWFLDVDGIKYYVDELGIEYYEDPRDGEYYGPQGQSLVLQQLPRDKEAGYLNALSGLELGA